VIVLFGFVFFFCDDHLIDVSRWRYRFRDTYGGWGVIS